MIQSTHQFSGKRSEDLNLLDISTLSEESSEGKALAILHAVSYRTTKEGQPFVRMSFEDINSMAITGFMFNINDYQTTAGNLTLLSGKVVELIYSVSFYRGDMNLTISEINPVPEEISQSTVQFFRGRAISTTEHLAACTAVFSDLPGNLMNSYITHCPLDSLSMYSSPDICKGICGYVLELLHQTLDACKSCSIESKLAFAMCLTNYCLIEEQSQMYRDQHIQLFIASMVDKAYGTTNALADRITEIAALFAHIATITSKDSYLLFNIYQTYRNSSNIEATLRYIPNHGIGVYDKYQIRR